MRFETPDFGIGSKVRIKPLENAEGRVVCIYWDHTGICYHVRYFHNGDAKTCRLFPDEIEAV